MRHFDQVDLVFFFGAMYGAGMAMPQSEKDALNEWEKHHIPLGLATSDWPGWKKYLGSMPAFEHFGSLKKEADKPKKPRVGFVYLMRNNRNGYTKIGFSVSPTQREQTLQAEEPDAEIIHVMRGSFGLERRLHSDYQSKRIRGEWFNLTASDVSQIKADYL